MKRMNILLTAGAFALIGSASAATISWSSVPYLNTGASKNVLGMGQFATTGTQWVAENSGGAAFTFDGINFVDPTVDFGGNHATAFHATGQSLSASATYGSSTANTVTIGLGGAGADLVSTHTYRIQLLVADGRGSKNGRTIEVDGVNQGVYATGVDGDSWGDFRLVTGTFVADSTSQTFTMEAFGGSSSKGGQLNALLVHEVPEPSSAALLGLGGLALILRRRK